MAKTEMAGGVTFTMKDDPRVTEVGRSCGAPPSTNCRSSGTPSGATCPSPVRVRPSRWRSPNRPGPTAAVSRSSPATPASGRSRGVGNPTPAAGRARRRPHRANSFRLDLVLSPDRGEVARLARHRGPRPGGREGGGRSRLGSVAFLVALRNEQADPGGPPGVHHPPLPSPPVARRLGRRRGLREGRRIHRDRPDGHRPGAAPRPPGGGPRGLTPTPPDSR